MPGGSHKSLLTQDWGSWGRQTYGSEDESVESSHGPGDSFPGWVTQCPTWVHGTVTTHDWLWWFSVSPGVLFQVQLQESGPCLVKPTQTLSLTCAVSLYSILTNPYHGHGSPSPQDRAWSGWGTYCMMEAFITAHPSKTTYLSWDMSKNKIPLQLSTVSTEDKAVHCCERSPARGLQCEPMGDTNLPWRVTWLTASTVSFPVAGADTHMNFSSWISVSAMHSDSGNLSCLSTSENSFLFIRFGHSGHSGVWMKSHVHP
jgi:hypothetical protein